MRSFKLEPYPHYKKVLRYELTAGTPQDLYEKNFSTVKSPYGLDNVGDGTFTGNEVLGYDGSPATEIYTDAGTVIIADGRFINTIAPLELVSIDTSGASISTAISSTSDEWIEVEPGDTLSRWIKSDINATITVWVGNSVVTSLYPETGILASIYPAWTDIRTDSTSHGQKLLNVVAPYLEETKIQTITFPKRSFVTDIPTGIKAFAYLTELPDEEYPIDVIGYGEGSPAPEYVLGPVEDVKEFIEAEESKHVYLLIGRQLFTSGEYEDLKIDGVSYQQEKIHIVNHFDYAGAFYDLPRLEDESNESYKARILDVWVNPPGASIERFETAVERESGCYINKVWELHDETVPWAEPNDPGTSLVFYQDPTQEHKELAEWARSQAKIGFDYFVWGNTLFDLYPHPWDLAEVPYLLDHSLSEESPAIIRQPGIGFGYDLLPIRYTHVFLSNYSITVGVSGYLETEEQIYPPVTVQGRVIPSANHTEYHNEFDGYITLEITSDSSPAVVYCYVIPISIPRDSWVASNTNTWQFALPNFQSTTTIVGGVKTGEVYVPVEIDQDDVVSYQIIDGRWDFETQTYIDNSPADQLTLGFEIDIYETISTNPWSVSGEGGHPQFVYAQYSTAVSSTVTAWEGVGTPFTITCNADHSVTDGEIPIPRNLESIEGLGTITYAIEVDSAIPGSIDIEASPADFTIQFLDTGQSPAQYTDSIVGWPDDDVTIVLSSSYQEYITKYTPNTHSTTQVFAGTLTESEPVRLHAVNREDFSLPDNFINPRYTLEVVGDVYVRLPEYVAENSGTSPIIYGEDNLVVELNPTYMYEWYPSVYPGTLYLSGEEYYLHAAPEVESVSGTQHTLSYPMAPGSVLSFSEPLVEIHFTDSNGVPTTTITQVMQGNGTQYLPIWYPNAVNITVNSVSKSLLTDGIVNFGSITNENTTYTVVYQVTDTYCVDYTNIVNGQYLPKIYLQAAHGGLSVTYTPISNEGYEVSTGIPTNPLFTMKNRDFLYIDDEITTPENVEIVTRPLVLYRQKPNPIFVQVTDSDGNGLAGVTVSFSGDVVDPGDDEDITDSDGYAHISVSPPAEGSSPEADGTITATVTEVSPAIYHALTYELVTIDGNTPAGLSPVSQTFQVAGVSAGIQLSMSLVLLDSNGDPVPSTEVDYEIWCSDPDGSETASSAYTNSDGIVTVSYTPDVIGRYVATFSVSGYYAYIGWELVEYT